MRKDIYAKNALVNGKILSNTHIEVSDHIITAIDTYSQLPENALEIQGVVIPGFIDIHCHGGGGKYFSAPSIPEIQSVIDTHRAHGTTTLMASLVTEPLDALKEQIARLVPFVASHALTGIHLEGPYLSHARCGAHDPLLLRAPSLQELEELLEVGEGSIAMVTIAPELPNAFLVIDFLVKSGVVVALGHSNADLETAKRAMDLGASVVTHFYNGLPALDHRKATITSGVLFDDRVLLELINDGHHVNAPATDLLLRSASERVLLVTDAMSAAGVGDGEYLIGALEVVVEDGVARLKSNGSLAGSTLTMDQAFFNFMKNSNMSLSQASFAASALPARALGLENRGEIALGKRADLLEIDVKKSLVYTL